MDARAVHHWVHLAVSLPDHPCHVWLRIRADDAKKVALESDRAVRHQSRRQPDLHANPVRVEKPAVSSR